MIPLATPPALLQPTQVAEPGATEWRGQYQGDPSPGSRLIQDARSWEKLWRSLDQPAPPLDFSRFCAVVAFAGQRPTGGFTVEFLEPVSDAQGLEVHWRVRAPRPDAMKTQALTRPWAVKAFPRPAGKIHVYPLPETR